MQKISILPANSTLSDSIRPHHLSILSYNILIPNHPRSWWVCKYYHPHTPMLQRQWPARQALLLQQLIHANSDLICLQEVNHQHFESDFEALHQQGYQSLLHQKGQFMRCATFWKQEKFTLLQAVHSYRCLITLFHINTDSPRSDQRKISAQELLLVINVHLSGGPKPDARIQQVHHALKKAQKIFAHYQIEPQHSQIILCGDYNTALHKHSLSHLLFHGEITPQDRDLKYPHTPLTKKGKTQPFRDWTDAYQQAYPGHLQALAPSVLARDFLFYFCHIPSPLPSGYSEIDATHNTSEERLYMYIMQARTRVKQEGIEILLPWFRPQFLHALHHMFMCFAKVDTQGQAYMGVSEIEKWIEKIQHRPKIGSEYENMLAYLQGKSVAEIIGYSSVSLQTNPQPSNPQPSNPKPSNPQPSNPRGNEGIDQVNTSAENVMKDDMSVGDNVNQIDEQGLINHRVKSDKTTRGRKGARGRKDTRGRKDPRGRKDTRGRKSTRGRKNRGGKAIRTHKVNTICKATTIRELKNNKSIDFITWRNLYLSEVLNGKWWAIAHDLSCCDVHHDLFSLPPLQSPNQASPSLHASKIAPSSSISSSPFKHTLYQTRIDHIMLHKLKLHAVRASIDKDDLQQAHHWELSIPNLHHPSDHLPIAVIFEHPLTHHNPDKP